MRTGIEGRELIKSYEKFCPKAYICPAGKLTIGYGHVILPGEKFPEEMTISEADELLSKDLEQREKAVLSLVKVPLKQSQFDASMSLVFNIGTAAFGGSTLLKLLNVSDYTGAEKEFLKWNKIKGVVSKGLTNRRVQEALLFGRK